MYGNTGSSSFSSFAESSSFDDGLYLDGLGLEQPLFRSLAVESTGGDHFQSSSTPSQSLWHKLDSQPGSSSLLGQLGASLVSTTLVEPPGHAMRKLEPAPIWLEKYSTCVAPPGSTQGNVLNKCLCSLQELSSIVVDTLPNKAKNKFKGVAFRGGNVSQFVAKQYQGMGGEIVVEFSRRSGDSLLFNVMFNEMMASLDDMVRYTNSLTGGGDPLAARARKRMRESVPLPILLELPEKQCAKRACPSVDFLLERLCSPYVDQQLQACSCLVSLSDDAEVSQEMVAVKSLPVLQQLLSSSIDELVRYAAIIVSNMLAAGSEVFLSEAGACLATTLFEILESPATLLLRDTKRHVAASLLSLAQHETKQQQQHQQQLAEESPRLFSPTRIQALKRYSRVEDSSLRNRVTATLALVAPV
jgi:hypothetical protein